mmetsp:Transcript_66858/g.184384  ORF Transcript_66858/g.184384 Transcript_66858/m.184384 type:complete len:220 (+) Transcript_66858:2997-3656(+)
MPRSTAGRASTRVPTTPSTSARWPRPASCPSLCGPSRRCACLPAWRGSCRATRAYTRTRWSRSYRQCRPRRPGRMRASPACCSLGRLRLTSLGCPWRVSDAVSLHTRGGGGPADRHRWPDRTGDDGSVARFRGGLPRARRPRAPLRAARARHALRLPCPLRDVPRQRLLGAGRGADAPHRPLAAVGGGRYARVVRERHGEASQILAAELGCAGAQRAAR